MTQFFVKNGISGTTVGKPLASQASAEKSAIRLSVKHGRSFDIIASDGTIYSNKTVSFAACGIIYACG